MSNFRPSKKGFKVACSGRCKVLCRPEFGAALVECDETCDVIFFWKNIESFNMKARTITMNNNRHIGLATDQEMEIFYDRYTTWLAE